MNVKDVLGKVSGIIGKLPFVKLAEKIPEGARTKLPFLNALIPLANHIASGLAIVVLVAALGGGGGGLPGSTWETGRGSRITFTKTTFSQYVHRTDGTIMNNTGTYTISGDELLLIYDADGFEATCTLMGSSLRHDTGGDVYTRIR